MLTVDQAIAAILGRCSPLPARMTPLIDALGLILAEEIVADLDLPPFEKALMDGYAVRSADLADAAESGFAIVEEILAGQMPTRPLQPGEAARIMTGAPLPVGSDAVVMVEKSRIEGSKVYLPGPVKPGQSRMTRGQEMRAGDVLLSPGIQVGATHLGLIASAGRDQVLAIPRPTIAILPTGDELVPPGQRPEGAQIRNSNGVMLAALAMGSGFRRTHECPIGSDDPIKLRQALSNELWMKEDRQRPAESIPGFGDVLIISGGVSAGTRDLVPSTLIDLGVEPVFHKVNVKPGKPLWFGVGPSRGDRPGALVFGLPGNPVSGVVSFHLFVKPALEALAGLPPKQTQLPTYSLGQPFRHRGDRPTYQPVRRENGELFPLDWAGSADLRTVAIADGFAAFPAGDRDYDAGEMLGFLKK